MEEKAKRVKIGGFNLPKAEVEKKERSSQEVFGKIRDLLFLRYSPEEILKDLSVRGRDYVAAKSRGILKGIVDEKQEALGAIDEQFIINSIVSEISGFGPIDVLFDDPKVTEVMVNGPNKVFIEKEGKITLTNIRFESDEQLKRIIDKIVQPLGRRIDESSPTVDARLPDGSRVNVVIPPISKEPIVTIRKFRKELFRKSDFIKLGTIEDNVSALLELFTKARLNIIVSGGTGTGKTTFLNFISSMIDGSERVITIEDSKELQLHQPHIVSLEARPPNIEGKGEVSIRDLVKNSLRMRPDRIIVGEVRGEEALDMLQAMNTGHDGSMSTIHANSPGDVISRLVSMVLMTGAELPVKAVVLMIMGAIDVIVHLYKYEDGSRKVGTIGEYVPDESSLLGIKFVPFMIFERNEELTDDKVTGKFVLTVKSTPRCYEKMKRHGIYYKPFEKTDEK